MRKTSSTEEEIPGTGACPEAQADGVPCEGTAKNCPDCAKASDKTAAAEESHPPSQSSM